MNQSRRRIEAYNKIRELLTHYKDCLDAHQFSGDGSLFAVRADEIGDANGDPGGFIQDFSAGSGVIIFLGDMGPLIPRGMELLD